jgi:hypothetical protein
MTFYGCLSPIAETTKRAAALIAGGPRQYTEATEGLTNRLEDFAAS